MFVFYKEKKKLILSVFLVLLDGIIVYFGPSYFHQLNYFYPMLTLSFLPFLFNGHDSDSYRLYFIIGLIYDLLYSHLFLFHALVFLFLGKIDSKILKSSQNSLLLYLLLVLINIVLYDGINFFLIVITNYQKVVFDDYLYKISHSLLVNLLSTFVYYFLQRKRLF